MIARDKLAEEPLLLERVPERPARWEVGKSSEERRSPRRRTLATFATMIAVFSGFAPTLLDGGRLGQDVFILLGFVLLGLSYGQAAGAVSSNFQPKYRYTGAALTSDLAWLIGAAFAPRVALGLSAHFGLAYVSVSLLSGAAATLAALSVNRALEARD
jgi:hypothetical protein